MTAKRTSLKNQAQPGEEPPPAGDMPLEQLSRHAIAAQLAKVIESERVIRDGHDPEGVHDMRVGIRTLRAVLQVLEESPVFDQQQMRDLRRRLRSVALALGRVRDGDVLMSHLDAYIAANPDAATALSPARENLADHVATEHGRLLHELDRSRTRKTLKRLHRLAEDTSASPADGHLVLVRHFLGSAIWRRYEAVLAYEQLMPGAPPATLHRLRITCKRLRYTAGLLQEALPAETAPVITTLRAVQDHLGSLQDQMRALETFAPLESADPTNEPLAAYVRTRTTERDRLQASFAPLWQRLSNLTFRHDLATCLARL